MNFEEEVVRSSRPPTQAVSRNDIDASQRSMDVSQQSESSKKHDSHVCESRCHICQRFRVRGILRAAEEDDTPTRSMSASGAAFRPSFTSLGQIDFDAPLPWMMNGHLSLAPAGAPQPPDDGLVVMQDRRGRSELC